MRPAINPAVIPTGGLVISPTASPIPDPAVSAVGNVATGPFVLAIARGNCQRGADSAGQAGRHCAGEPVGDTEGKPACDTAHEAECESGQPDAAP